MTTHDMQPTEARHETVDTTPDFEAPAQTARPAAESYQAPADTAQPPAESYDAPVETAPPAENRGAPASSLDSTDQMLFNDSELTDMRSRWTEVQSAFVDDPRDCVQKADGLVAEVVDKLTAGFAGARAHLEEQWSRGEEASTEDLRLALKRYREFFERLLAV